ncbi:MAG: universal stress protein [Actinomycetota bacterium]
MATTAANPPLVVGVDGSEVALIALDWASDEAAANGWPLRLVYVAERYAAHVSTMVVGREIADTVFAEARQRLRRRGRRGLEVTAAMRHGSPRRVLLREASRTRGLVIGREGAGQFAELTLGSTALACATHARVPVIVVPRSWRPRQAGERTIVLGVDGSPRCRAAIEYAFATAARQGARIVAVLAVRRPEREATEQVIDSDGAAQAKRILTEQLDEWRSKFPEVPVTEVVEAGHAAAVIKRHAADADLVVVGGRGQGTVTGMLLGSIARAVLQHVDRPVAVVRGRR